MADLNDTDGYGLQFIPRQPIIFTPDTDPCRMIVDGGYCQPFASDTDIEIQIIRTPCGDDLDCTEGSPSYGANIVANEEFTTDILSWTVTGGAWAWNAANGGCARGVAMSPGTIYQSFAGEVGVYRITLEILGATTGTSGVYRNTELLQDCSTDGVYQFIYANLNDPFEVGVYRSSLFDGDLLYLTIERVIYCYDGTGWVYLSESDTYIHIQGYTVGLMAQVPYMNANTWYQVTILIENKTDGEVRFIAGSNASEWYDSDGQFTFTIFTGALTQSGFDPSSLFDGEVSVVSVYEMAEPSQIDLVDADDTSIVIADLLPYYTLIGDRINIKFNYDQLLADGALATEEELPRCFRIAIDAICSPVGGNMITNGQFNGGSGSSITGWTAINAPSMAIFDFSNMQVERSLIGQTLGPRWKNDTNPLMTQGDYLLVFNLTKNDDTTNIAVRFSMDGVLFSDWFTQIANNQTFQFTGYVPSGGAYNQMCLVEYSFAHDGVAVLGQIAIDSVRLYKTSSSVQPKISNCLTILTDEELECHKVMEAYSECSAGGFDFTNFRLRMLVPLMRWGSTYPTEENTYIHSDGRNERTYFQLDKVWQARTDRMDESGHDALSLMLLLEHFSVDSTEYFSKSKSYNKDNLRDWKRNLHRASFELSEMQSVVFGNKCRDCQSPDAGLDCIDICHEVVGLWEETPASEGWYYTEENNTLYYWDGDSWEEEEPCDGYILTAGGQMLIWNDVTDSWEIFIGFDSVSDDTVDVTITATIPATCAAQVIVTITGSGETESATQFYTAAQLASGVSFTMPVDPFTFHLSVRCGACIYTSVINETYA